MSSNKIVLLVLVALQWNCCFSQEEIAIVIPWESPRILTQGDQSILVPSIQNEFLDGRKPVFTWSKLLKPTEDYKLSLEVVSTEPALSKEIDYLQNEYLKVGDVSYELGTHNSNTDRFARLTLFPFVKVGGAIHRITEVEVKLGKGTPVVPQAIPKDFVTASVLSDGSGVWYKISVAKDGVYMIDKQFLIDCFADQGVNLDNIDPNDINIFGNGDGRLPELNSVPRTDDLAKNAIQIVGGDDGSFDDNDYILFYGWGPHRVYSNGTAEMRLDTNPYSDISTYFININASDTPLRIGDLTDVDDPVTNFVSTFSYFAQYGIDVVSLVKGGQRWYGELFDSGQLERTFSFIVPEIDVTSSATFDVWLASKNAGGGGNTHAYSINGVSMGSANLPTGSEYGRGYYSFSPTIPSTNMALKMTVNITSPNVVTYLDYISLNARRGIAMVGSQFNFRDLSSVGLGNVSQYTVTGLTSSGFVWDVTDRHIPKRIIGGFVGSDYIFKQGADTIREYTASTGGDFLTPNKVGITRFQNLHGLAQADYLIVTHPYFIDGAERLANLHRENGLSVHVVTTGQVYNEFSSGMIDPTAIRSFVKMFYDRGALTPENRPKYLLLFGDGTYDPKNRVPNNNNYVVTYQVANSENHIDALVTDDYFGMLDDNESLGSNDMMDIGVGRLLISSTQIAKEQVDKIEHYMRNGSDIYSMANTNCSSNDGSSTFGDWRSKYTQSADDEEGGYFVITDCEPLYTTLTDSFSSINVDKIYLDAFPQVASAGGGRYPDAQEAINDRIERGSLIFNYVGHGGEVGVAEERVITVPQIQAWRNIDKLTLMISATCEFTKYDDPDRISAGEWASLNPYGGAIALMTTTRSVYFSTNTNTIRSIFKYAFSRDDNHLPLTFGEIIRLTKNDFSGSINKRSFTLIGDPALRIALPRLNIVTDSVNGLNPALSMDTIRALSKVTIKGHVEDFDGNIMTGFNGVAYPTVLDKPRQLKTLGNDSESPVIDFELQNNKLYSGKASIVNGYFEFSFVVPKDIDYSVDFGKISYYAENGLLDAIGDDQRVYIGGIDPNGIIDNEGPQIELYLNENTFVNGGITDETPILIAKLFDENGINTVGNGIGHDLIAVLDNETGNPIVLNDYYISDLDSYQSGEVRYNFSDLEPGEHTLNLKVWDVNNNSSEVSIDFVVQEKMDIALDHVLNYPNPFTTYTEFYFEHNQACVDLEAQIQVFTVSGRLVKTINQPVQCDGFRSKGIPWDGRDEFGDQLAKGVYVYRLTVTTPEGLKAEETEKLVILK
ncbi:MAG: type IX secretion system sortase PorU [Crocinitomicaceae bacterium]|nr:type IX secretion system sortase PorU [Crocinitomicaceae bacterium]